MRTRPFHQVDVFSDQAYRGNPLAVVIDAEGLTGGQMQHFANWTNLSETTFLLPPTDPRADYRVRIFTGSEEFPFAGHPTLGSAHTWLQAGGVPKSTGYVVQECGAGLVRVKHDAGRRLAFAAPPLTRFGPVEEPLRRQLAAALRVADADIVDASWLVNGPEWIGVLLASAGHVLAIEPDYAAMGDLKVGIIGPRGGGDTDFEVRTFLPGDAIFEDPVTGSFNAGAAQWLIGSGRAPETYVAAQGTVLGRAGRIHVQAEDGEIWVGGKSTTCIRGDVLL